MTQSNLRGVWWMVATVAAFAIQDGFSRLVAAEYNTLMVVAVRYWVFAAFVLGRALQRPEGFRAAVKTKRMPSHVFRAALLVAEICLMVQAYTLIGLIHAHAVFAVCPLLVVAMSGPLLGERIGLARWLAVGVGFVGELIILQPGFGVFSAWALLPAFGACLFALYAILTRHVSDRDASSTSFFYTGMVGAAAMTLVGFFFWHPMTPGDWAWMAVLCVFSAAGHWCLIKAYSLAEAAAIQPFAYLQLVWIAILGVTLFGEALAPNVAIGAALVVSAGLFTLWRQYTNTP